jgi:tetratricopeptide (TPR) repeat protein
MHRYGPRAYHHTYHDRPYAIRHSYRSHHIYRDHCHRTHYRSIWPRYHFTLSYHFGHHSHFTYCYPYYHRKYIFVSLGGCWPTSYHYRRYYWYGYHPYRWYGYYPVAAEIRGDSYNYYTYNYYYTGETESVDYGPVETNYITPVDHTTFADVRAKLAAQAADPAQATLADMYFEEGVKAFENGDYVTAIQKFAAAMELAPDDIILPFAYAQALFANGQYSEAVVVLRAALANISPEEQTVFYPRGLYPNDDELFDHIDKLAEKADFYTFDADLQLLLGYHLLGVGELDAAIEPLTRAGHDFMNVEASQILLKLLETIKAQAAIEAADQSNSN